MASRRASGLVQSWKLDVTACNLAVETSLIDIGGEENDQNIWLKNVPLL